jgi:hypothetical protein
VVIKIANFGERASDVVGLKFQMARGSFFPRRAFYTRGA